MNMAVLYRLKMNYAYLKIYKNNHVFYLFLQNLILLIDNLTKYNILFFMKIKLKFYICYFYGKLTKSRRKSIVNLQKKEY